jgi:hypothetical protein
MDDYNRDERDENEVEQRENHGMSRRRRTLYSVLVALVLLVSCGLLANFLVLPMMNSADAKAPEAAAEVAAPVEEMPAEAPVVAQPAAEAEVAAPVVAPEVEVAPTAAPEVAQPVVEAEAAAPVVAAEEVEEPKTPEDARQVGSGADIITGWTDPSASKQVIGGSFSSTVRSFMAAEGTSPAETQIVCVSSDPGLLQKKDSSGKVLVSWRDAKRGFVACVVLNTGETIEVIGVGFNDANGHFNTWSEVYSIPEGVKPDDVAKLKIDEWQQREKKPFAFSFYDGATTPTFLAQP